MKPVQGLLSAVALCVASAAISGAAVAHTYPDRPITWVVPSSAGSGFDVISRIITPKLSEVLGQTVVVQNIAGAGATVGATTVAEAKPDGYNILLVNANHTAAEALYKDLKYNLIESFDPIVRFTNSYHVLVVRKDLEAQNLAELIEMAKKDPGGLDYASAGVGSVTFMCTEIFKVAAGIELTHIPYAGGGPAMASLVAGETDFYGAPYSTAKPFIQEGTVRALAMTSPERVSFEPDMPAASETVPGYQFMSWYGLVVPKGTPEDIRGKIRAALAEALADPAVKKPLADLGFEPIDEGPEEFAAFLKNEVDVTKKIVEDAGIQPQ